MRKSSQISKQEHAQAIEYARQNLAAGAHEQAIVLHLTGQYRCSPAVAKRWVRVAREQIVATGAEDPDFFVGQLITRCQSLYAKAVNDGDHALAIQIVQTEFTIRLKAADLVSVKRDEGEEAVLRHLQRVSRRVANAIMPPKEEE